MAAVKEKIDPPRCYSDASKLAACGNITQLTALIDKNAGSVTVPDSLGGFPIAWAARSGHSDAVQLLLKQDCDTNSPTWRNLRPLHHAVNGYYEDVVKELLGKEGTDVDAKDEGGTTALHVVRTRGPQSSRSAHHYYSALTFLPAGERARRSQHLPGELGGGGAGQHGTPTDP